jgi:proteasome lid subunit RPN8/RPN11
MQRAAKQALPEEACGLLFGASDAVTACEIARNVAQDPVRQFEVDPAALFAALRAERAGGKRLIGYWHSHPSGDPTPSATDAAMAAADGKLWLIVAGTSVAAWRAGEHGLHGRFAEIALEIGD